MSTTSADAFVARLESDPEFAERLAALRDDPDAVMIVLVDEGFDATPEEIRDAVVSTLGSQMSEEQLAAVAGGLSTGDIVGYSIGAVGIAAAVAGGAAAAAI